MENRKHGVWTAKKNKQLSICGTVSLFGHIVADMSTKLNCSLHLKFMAK